MDKDERLRITVVTKRLNTTPTWYVVDVVVLCGCCLQRVKERPGEGCLRVVELGELHNLKVGIVTSSEDRRKVGGCLKSAVCVREEGVRRSQCTSVVWVLVPQKKTYDRDYTIPSKTMHRFW